jgi:hypothetical protein
MRCLAVASTIAAVVGALLFASVAQAGIGFLPGPAGFESSISNENGTPDNLAGSHPYEVTGSFSLRTTTNGEGKLLPEGGELREAAVNAPPGVIGDAQAVPVCSDIEFFTLVEDAEHTGGPSCNRETIVGIFHVTGGSAGSFYVPVYNIQPSAGVPAEFGAAFAGFPILFQATVRSDGDYGISISVHNISQSFPITASALTLWGVPADPSHDPLRGPRCLNIAYGTSEGNCPTKATPRALITLPTSCAGPQATTINADSWSDPELYATDSFLTENSLGNPAGFEGCSELSFTPTIAAKPTTDIAEAPTGLDFHLNVADEGLTDPTGRAQSQIKKTVVTLPEGFTLDPSAGPGLEGCTPSEYHRETASSAPGAGCPNASKIGEVSIETPLLEKEIEGSLFIAEPYENPFDSLLAIYVVAKLPERGLLIKAAGKVEPNPVTGQLTTTFDNLPQLPFSHFNLHFREGQSAPLISPPSCGTYTTDASLVPRSAVDPEDPAPEEVVNDTSSFTVTRGVGGGACPSGGIPPFKPQVISGTQNNDAGSYSPFYLHIVREDGEQELIKFSTTLPPGLTGNLSGIPFCPEADIEAARRASGREELNDPSCPAASEIGHTLVAAGVGSVLAQTPGKIYLAGPYHGAPLSIVSITSATVGPFDLGTVVIRFALDINPITAQVEVSGAQSDAIPHIIEGIVVHVRDIRVYMNRPDFTVNPTNCAPLTITDRIVGSGAGYANPAGQDTLNVTTPFQAADCSSLAFKPAFKVTATGKTSRSQGAGLSVKLTVSGAQGTQSNIRSVKVDLPKQLPSRLTTLQKACPDSVFEANPAACPADSKVGTAKAITPVLPVPLEGPAYFVSHGGAKFPELIVVLQGYGFTIDLHGETFISKAGITSSTFHTVPDQPVTSFELTLPQGTDSALAANGNLCTAKLTMPTAFVAQNGATIHQTTPIAVTGCPKAVRHERKKAHRNGPLGA